MADGTPEEPASQVDPKVLVGLFESFLLGEEPSLTPVDVAERTGIDLETARMRWRSLGFTAVEDDEVAFTEADVHALELTERLSQLGIVKPETESALVRTLGRSFARLAEWQMTLVARSVDMETTSVEELGELMAEITPLMEEVMDYVWRRHTLTAASRLLLAPGDDEDEAPALGVGFADIVGYTRQSRSLKEPELAALVERFEATALAVITENNGRIIKTIGDEVLFVADTAEDTAEIALLLTEMHLQDEDFPELRVGAAYGPVLSRLGDIYGPVVNLASRLTGIARPGRVLIDKGMADELQENEHEDYRLRKTRRTSVKGYRRLEPWSLRRPVGQNPEFDPEKLPGPASQFVAQTAQDILRRVDERQAGGEGAVDGEGVEERPGG